MSDLSLWNYEIGGKMEVIRTKTWQDGTQRIYDIDCGQSYKDFLLFDNTSWTCSLKDAKLCTAVVCWMRFFRIVFLCAYDACWNESFRRQTFIPMPLFHTHRNLVFNSIISVLGDYYWPLDSKNTDQNSTGKWKKAIVVNNRPTCLVRM